MKSNYKKLGEYIRQVDIRNKEGKETNLLGVSVQKTFIPSIANTVGTDFTKYKVVKRNQFTYIPDTSRRGDKIGIAYLKDLDEGLVSNVYTVFEVIDENKLNPEYLMLWFSRPEFDRYARFKSHGSVREVFDWEQMCNVELPIPPIEKQNGIVSAYNAISNRIVLKRQINENLEAQLSVLYHQIFDIPENSTNGIIDNLGEIIGGATPSTSVLKFFCTNGIPWITPKDLTSTGLKYIYRGEISITEEAYKSCSTKLMPTGTVLFTSRAPVGTVAIAMNDICTNQGFKSVVPKTEIGTAFVYCFLKENKQLIESHASGTTFMEVSGNTLKNIPAIIPKPAIAQEFTKLCNPLFEQQLQNETEICILQELRSSIVSSISSN